MVLKQSYLLIFSLQGLGGRQGEGENNPGIRPGLRALHNSCLDANTSTDVLLYSVSSMHQTAVRLLKLEGAGEARSDRTHTLKRAKRILLLREIFYGDT